MASPFVQTDDNGNFINLGKIYDVYGYLAERAEHADEAAAQSPIANQLTGVSSGSLNNENGGDMIAVVLTAGQSYTFSYRGAGDNGIIDPYLRLLGIDKATVITEDDDGGFDRTSQITFTPTVSGTYWLNATSWFQADPTAPAYQDNGDYTIAQWSPDAGQDAGATIATTTRTLGAGTNYEYLENFGDRDYYAVQLTAGNVYNFTYNGGVAGEAVDLGESVGVLGLYNAAGAAVVGLSVNTGGETTISYFAQQSGTFYLRAEAYSNAVFIGGLPPQRGGYTIDITARALSELDPLDAVDWKSSDVIDTTLVNGVPTAKVYFANAGETFGERTGANPINSFGWNDIEKAAVMDALKEYTKILGIVYEITTVASEAEFRLITTAGPGVNYGAYMYPQDPVYGSQEGISAYNVNSGGWDKPGVSTQNLPGDQVSLDKGGYSYAVILHEMGHGHGLAHPHDRGGGSDVLVGVAGPNGPGTYGVFDLNQGIYTVMSYNDAAPRGVNGPSPFTISGIGRGWSGTLGAFDIAQLQLKYGVRPDYATGDDIYLLKDVNAKGTYYETIYDTAGNDTIAYSGARNVSIDLLAATLDYTATGGGVLSYATGIFGGYTIANGVVIENATGDAGNDVLIGNHVGNRLTGNAGNDTLLGRDGVDLLIGGDGNDILNGGAGNMDELIGGLGNDRFVFNTANDKDKIRDFDSGNDTIDFTAFGIDRSDVKITGGNVFADTDNDGNYDLHIVVQGDRVLFSDILFTTQTFAADPMANAQIA